MLTTLKENAKYGEENGVMKERKSGVLALHLSQHFKLFFFHFLDPI